MALYKGSQKVAGSAGVGFDPQNAGTTGQVLTKTATGYNWDDANGFNPENTGTTGQVLTKTADRYEWQDPSGSDYSWVTKTPGASYQAMQGPCDSGFHIPTNTEFANLNTVGQTLGAWDSSGAVNFSTYLKIPMNGWLSETTGEPVYQGDRTQLRSSVHGGSGKGIYILAYNNTIHLNLESLINRGCNIRPFKDIPVVPDSSWTVLYQGTGTAGIYHNSTLGLISLSSDGTTWITIADKNLGATSVYNYGDTLSESNCGKYYQRGNNYGFARSGATVTSSTTVDASSYGPGNYYSSSTFIIGNSAWDTSDNANLRGGGITVGVELSLRTIVNIPTSDFILTAPATLAEGEEYVIRIISEDNYTMTLGTGFTNPRNVDTSLSYYATDQFVFLAVGGVLELQPLVATGE